MEEEEAASRVEKRSSSESLLVERGGTGVREVRREGGGGMSFTGMREGSCLVDEGIVRAERGDRKTNPQNRERGIADLTVAGVGSL